MNRPRGATFEAQAPKPSTASNCCFGWVAR